MNNPSAIDTMKAELRKINYAIVECTDDHGYVRNASRYRYQLLVQKAKALKESIEWMEERVYVGEHQVEVEGGIVPQLKTYGN